MLHAPARVLLVITAIGWLGLAAPVVALAAGAPGEPSAAVDFPVPLEHYQGEEGLSTGQVVARRAAAEPLNVVATAIFLLAIVHTFLAPRIAAYAHRLVHTPAADRDGDGTIDAHERPVDRRSFKAEILHFFGEIEAVFGLWVVPLVVAITWAKGWATVDHLFAHSLTFTEPMFVVVIMTMAATRPVLQFARDVIGRLAAVGGGTPLAWWVTILVVGPLLGSFITEPAAMVICALLLSRELFDVGVSRRLAYATLGLLFVNVSVGGTLTHFAAPPVLMVAGKWGWGLSHMLVSFGWKAVVGVVLATTLYGLLFRRELSSLAGRAAGRTRPGERGERVPAWVVATHLAFLAWTVLTAHTPALFVGGFLFFLAFAQASAPHQSKIDLKPALLVGFFLAGLVIHGSLQQWWIAPVLSQLGPLALMVGATVLTAFNDNAAITYLASLVPGFTPELQYAVVAGAVTGGGLTVIANAPNPAGQALLGRYFEGGISPLGLAGAALAPTVIVGACYLLLG